MLYDLIIVGAGPAGITAAIYAARRKLNFLIFGMDIGGQVSWSAEVDNYPGEIHLTGIELTKKFYEHLLHYKVKIRNEEVKKITKKGKIINVKTTKSCYKSKAVIIASGKMPRKLNVPGEEELRGKGVSYCVVCDGPLFKGKRVAVIGGGNSALEAVLYLEKYAKKIYLINITSKLTGEPYLIEKISSIKKLQIFNNSRTTSIQGKDRVEGLTFLQEGKEKSLKLDGVFIEIGLISKAYFIDIVKKNKYGEIKIFRRTDTYLENMTSVKGIFAAGDVTDIPAKQIIVAAGEGAKAALAAFNYLNQWK